MIYTEEIPGYGDLMTIEDFKELVDSGCLISNDGIGFYCKDGKMSHFEVFTIQGKLLCQDATHVCWFNK